ncbi:hypothetical protein [Thiobacillus thioparus]|uniref:hypothetical protein n=1 Tax=Thiobacillus thioparus TaxID=931 RepID=UPI0014612E5B|nr:hypothetical protein [Thiobacillus thioparus]
MKIHRTIRVVVWSTAILAGPSLVDALASEIRMTELGGKYEASTAVAIYRMSANAPDTRYVAHGRAMSPHVSEVNGWALVSTLLGLINMRLWYAGKKRLPTLN